MSASNYIDALAAEIRRHTPIDLVPDAAEDPALLFRLYALLALSKGDAVTTRDIHDAWAVWMAARGEAHESLVPFEQLSSATQAEDGPFVDAVRAALK
ncbi:MAG TPA: hypothetical protein VLJ42_01065 [Solirubrobacteraceae bacterium]|nr:hypothetical protein [Solirubrobacteraceae bacterium]